MKLSVILLTVKQTLAVINGGLRQSVDFRSKLINLGLQQIAVQFGRCIGRLHGQYSYALQHGFDLLYSAISGVQQRTGVGDIFGRLSLPSDARTQG
jgi:hypothetical protein